MAATRRRRLRRSNKANRVARARVSRLCIWSRDEHGTSYVSVSRSQARLDESVGSHRDDMRDDISGRAYRTCRRSSELLELISYRSDKSGWTADSMCRERKGRYKVWDPLVPMG